MRNMKHDISTPSGRIIRLEAPWGSPLGPLTNLTFESVEPLPEDPDPYELIPLGQVRTLAPTRRLDVDLFIRCVTHEDGIDHPEVHLFNEDGSDQDRPDLWEIVGITLAQPSQRLLTACGDLMDLLTEAHREGDFDAVRALMVEGLLNEGLSVSLALAYCHFEDARHAVSLLRRWSGVVKGMIGFYLDAPVNRIGTTGWEWMTGNWDAPLVRARQAAKEQA